MAVLDSHRFTHVLAASDTYFFAEFDNHSIDVWAKDSTTPVATIPHSLQEVSSIQFIKGFLLAGGRSGNIEIWELFEEGSPYPRFEAKIEFFRN